MENTKGEMWSCEAHSAESTRAQGGQRPVRDAVDRRTTMECERPALMEVSREEVDAIQ